MTPQDDRKSPAELFLKNRYEWEAMLIGSMIGAPGKLDKVESFVDAEDINEKIYNEAFDLIIDLANRDMLTINRLAARLAKYNVIPDDPIEDSFDVFNHLRSIVDMGSSTDPVTCAQEVRRLANRERVSLIAEWASENAITDELSEDQFFHQFDEAINLLYRTSGTKRKMADIDDGVDDWLEDLEHNPEKHSGLNTGIRSLDKLMGGLLPTDCIVVGGRPGMGKSIVGTSFAYASALEGQHAAIFSMEMGRDQVRARILSDILRDEYRLKYSDVIKGNVTKEDRFALEGAIKILKTLPISVDDRPKRSSAQIAMACRRIARQCENDGRKLGVVVIDYLQLMAASKHWRGNQNMIVSENSGDLKQLAMDLDCPVVVISQLSRALEGRTDKRPVLSDLRDSGSVEQDANIVMFPYRAEYYLEREYRQAKNDGEKADIRAELDLVKNTCEIIIAKQRNGPTGSTVCDFDAATASMRDRFFLFPKDDDHQRQEEMI